MTSFKHLALLILVVISFLQRPTFATTKKTYVVYLGSYPHGSNQDANIAEHSHYELMKLVLGSEAKAKESVLYHYNNFINGFTANLTEEEAERLKKMPNVVSVFESKDMSIPERPSNSQGSLGLEQN